MQANTSTITVRAEVPEDEPFLFELYASTRADELEAWGWPPEMRTSFLATQFKAHQGLRHAFCNAEFQIVLLDGVKAGRLVLNRTGEALYVLDMALLPTYRNAGVGTSLLQRVFGEAAATSKPVRLHVLKSNRAARFYQRLGFVQAGETETHWEMEWRAPVAPVVEPLLPDSLKLPLQFDPARLQADLARILDADHVPHFNTAYYEGDWSAVPLRSIGGRIDHIYPDPTAKDAFADTPLLERCAYVREALTSLRCPQRAVRFLRLKAGSIIKEHRDYELGFEDGEVRLHIPVVTNAKVEFILNQTRVTMSEGECWYLNVNQPHRVANRGATDRVHLVADCVLNDWLRELLLSAAAEKKKKTLVS
ncbi:MAG TPA: GNAT family N-acetyltransferase [Verrucomicrobiae bacterium]|nr:GNAT family N-acetyltransferase [Verrucomicrobiae bacterium]